MEWQWCGTHSLPVRVENTGLSLNPRPALSYIQTRVSLDMSLCISLHISDDIPEKKGYILLLCSISLTPHVWSFWLDWHNAMEIHVNVFTCIDKSVRASKEVSDKPSITLKHKFATSMVMSVTIWNSYATTCSHSESYFFYAIIKCLASNSSSHKWCKWWPHVHPQLAKPSDTDVIDNDIIKHNATFQGRIHGSWGKVLHSGTHWAVSWIWRAHWSFTTCGTTMIKFSGNQLACCCWPVKSESNNCFHFLLGT